MRWALVFDVDGLIADTESVNAAASVLMFQELYGVTVQPQDFRPFIGTGDARYCEGVAERYGVIIDAHAAVQRRAENFFKILAEKPLPAFPGVIELVQAARERSDVGLAIATSGLKSKQFPVIEGAGLKLEWFDVIITGDLVTRKKPDPEIYLLAAQELGLPPACCIVFEDAPVGVTAAKAAGCVCVAVTNSVGREELAAADLVVDSLAEVTAQELEGLLRRCS